MSDKNDSVNNTEREQFPTPRTDAVEVTLLRGQIALVDASDLERVQGFKWYAVRQGCCRRGKQYTYDTHIVCARINHRTTYLHRFLLDAPRGKVVDHVNGNPLDNRRANLRICERSQNNANSRVPSNSSSGYKGVGLYKPKSWTVAKWRAQIQKDGVKKVIGYFDSAEDAAKAYDEEAVRMFGEFAKTNASMRRAFEEGK